MAERPWPESAVEQIGALLELVAATPSTAREVRKDDDGPYRGGPEPL